MWSPPVCKFAVCQFGKISKSAHRKINNGGMEKRPEMDHLYFVWSLDVLQNFELYEMVHYKVVQLLAFFTAGLRSS
jgi:hypothetical protein